jgi:hypothetical protein
MCVRPACYIPAPEPISPQRDHAARLILRRNLATLAELGAITGFLAMVLIWAALGAGA